MTRVKYSAERTFWTLRDVGPRAKQSFTARGSVWRRKPPSCSNCTSRTVVAPALVRDEAEGNGHDEADDNPQRQDPVDYVHSTFSLITNKISPYISSASLTSLKMPYSGGRLCAVGQRTNKNQQQAVSEKNGLPGLKVKCVNRPDRLMHEGWYKIKAMLSSDHALLPRVGLVSRIVKPVPIIF
jgi:hypothetical protein